MAGQEHFFSKEWKRLMEPILFIAKKLAGPFSDPFGPSSQPVSIDQDELDKLGRFLERIRATLKDAERRDVRDEAVKLWLTELRDLECDAEDIMEKFEYELHRTTRLQEFWLKQEPANLGKRKREVSLLLSSALERLPLMISKIRERYNDLSFDREALRLRNSDGKLRPDNVPRPPSSSAIRGGFYGREKDMDEVIKMLVSDAPQGNQAFSIIPIVGMPGVGKTTLVQNVFCAPEVHQQFDLTVWVHVSQDSDVLRITRSVIEVVTQEACNLQELDMHQRILRQKIEGRRFLLVLDNAWNENRDFWETLFIPLESCGRGSKIIISTRNVNVAHAMGVRPAYHLSCLPDHDCWKIFKERAFVDQNQNSHQNLIQIGKKIIVKCRGLPLAAGALGDFLSSKTDEEQWEDVLQNDLWNEDGYDVLPILRWSYDHLPMPLKRCFEYSSLFPKGYLFQRSQMIQLWIAQGFIKPDKASRPEDIGVKYIDQLVERSFLQPTPFYDRSEEEYVMHDLFHELAESMSCNECSRMEDRELCEVHKRTRHLSFVSHESHRQKVIEFKSFDGQDLRSLLFVARLPLDEKHDKISFMVRIPSNRFMFPECLRALDLSNTDIEELPFSIGRVIHLRYLGLKNTRIKQLPESICSLFKMQALILRDCHYLEEIPQAMKHLLSLRHVELPSMQKNTDIHMPSVIGALTCLQTLSVSVMRNDHRSCTLTELENLEELRDLHISGLSNVIDGQDAHRAKLKEKQKLQNLTLQWFSLNQMPHDLDDKAVYDVLEGLQPHSNIKLLAIRDYCGKRFPGWIGDQWFSKLVTLTLTGCGRCEELPPLGQLPCLKHLRVQQMTGIQYVGREFCSSENGMRRCFLSLETLVFSEMSVWEVWCGVEDGDFPCLQSLTISRCCKLRMLPRFNSLTKLGIHYCERLHDIPLVSSLKFLQMEGLPQLKNLWSLTHLSKIETLEIACCEQLSLVGDLRPLSSLRHLKLTKCSVLQLPSDENLLLLPPELKIVDIHGACPLLSQWNPSGFEEYNNLNQESRILVRCQEPNWSQQTDDDPLQIHYSSRHNNLEQEAEDISGASSFICLKES